MSNARKQIFPKYIKKQIIPKYIDVFQYVNEIKEINNSNLDIFRILLDI